MQGETGLIKGSLAAWTLTPACRNAALRCAGMSHENGLRAWVKVSVTVRKPVSFSVKGLRQVLRTNDRAE